MSTRSLNKVMIIGNLTNKPELRYTPQNHAVTSFGVATNRTWNDSDSNQQESTEFHNIVAWNKLAELCVQLLDKGDKVFIGGRLQTRTWDDQDGHKNYKTEIVCEDMLVLHKQNGGPSSDRGSDNATAKDDFDVSDFADFDVVDNKESEVKDSNVEEKKDDNLPF